MEQAIKLLMEAEGTDVLAADLMDYFRGLSGHPELRSGSVSQPYDFVEGMG